MTREERAKAIWVLDDMKVKIDIPKVAVTQNNRNWALDMAIETLEQEQKADQFTNWVAEKIFDGACEDEAFAEICCRKLAKLGIVRANGDEWELVEPMKSEEE